MSRREDILETCVRALGQLQAEEVGYAISYLFWAFRREIVCSSTDREVALRSVLSLRALESADAVLVFADSPIERLVLLALITEGWRTMVEEHDATIPLSVVERFRTWESSFRRARAVVMREKPSEIVLVQPEFEIEGRIVRADFFVMRTRTVIEVDGHDFHERTKEQAQRDKSRDRALTMQGLVVLRFTGSEIFANPWIVSDTIDAMRGNDEEAKQEETESTSQNP